MNVVLPVSNFFRGYDLNLKKEMLAIIKLALPVVFTQLSFMAMNVTDIVMAGRLSPQDLAAVSVATSFAMPVYLLVMGILMAANPIVAHLYGANQLDRIGEKFRQTLWLGVICSVPCILLMRNAGPVFAYMGIEPRVQELALGYLRAIAWGWLPAFAFVGMRFFNEGLGVVKSTTVILMLSVPLNVVGNYIFMYGHLGLPAMGAVGTGYASALDFLFMSLAIGFVSWKRNQKRFNLFGFSWPNWTDLKEMLTVGLPNGVSLTMEVSLFAVIGLLIGSIGVAEVGAHQIAINISSVTFMIPLGISIAVTIRVGQAMGRRDALAIRQSGAASLLLASLIQVTTALIMLIFANQLVGFYSSDQAVAGLAASLLFYAAIFQLSDGLQVIGLGLLRGLKDTRIPMFANIISYWLVGMPVGYYFGMVRGMGTEGFWLGLMAGLTMAAILHNGRFIYLLKRNSDLQTADYNVLT